MADTNILYDRTRSSQAFQFCRGCRRGSSRDQRKPGSARDGAGSSEAIFGKPC
mgnify:CR=1 FL=1